MGVLDLFKLDDRVAVVTGGAKSIGMYYTTALLEAGAKVVAADIDANAVHDTTARLSEEHPGRVMGVVVDVSDRESLAGMVRAVDSRWGRLDIVVNNAALFAALPVRESPWGIPAEEWDAVMRTNIRGIYDCTEACLALMTRGGWGRVINIASGLVFVGSQNLPNYAASKGAVANLTKTMAAALGRHGIAVNSIAPGLTDSPSLLARRNELARTAPGALEAQGSASLAERRVIKRAEVPDDLLGALIYLASPASDFVSGQMLLVDGGMTFH